MIRPLPRPLVMGILNLTPDSFSDGGRFVGVQAALDHGLALLEAGADWLDVGGESTRPGAEPVSEGVEADRVLPVISALRGERPDVRLSIDTRKPAIARAAVAAGAAMWNDVTALSGATDSLTVAASLQVPIVLMHMRGDPRTMQRDPHYADPVEEVRAELLARAEAAMAAGVTHDRIWLDPGIGFGKTAAHNLALMAHLGRLTATGFPVLLGASRKRTILSIDPTAVDPQDRLGGSLALALHGAACGVAMLRVHDVRETVQALAVRAALDPRRPNHLS